MGGIVLALILRCAAAFSCTSGDPARGRDLVQVKSVAKQAKQALEWRVLQRFPPMTLRQPVGSCKNIGRQFPELVSRDRSILKSYADYVCASDYFITDPHVALASEMVEIHGGCANAMRWPLKVIAANSTHFANAFRTYDATSDKKLKGLETVLVDHDVVMISSTHLPIGMEYQHMLIDFLPAAWMVTSTLRGKKLLTHEPLQKVILQFMGVPSENILNIPFPELGGFWICTTKSLHVWRAAPERRAQPVKHTRGFADFWHRLLGFQVGHEVSDAISRAAAWKEILPHQVTFMQRCTHRRSLANEQELLASISRVLLDSNRSEELVSMCAGRESWLVQAEQVRRSKLIIGAHGGAMSNMVFARPSTGIIEIVGSPDAQRHADPKGVWPGYQSHWYGGAGASFNFFRVVLYERRQSELVARVEDVEEALRQWFAHDSAPTRA